MKCVETYRIFFYLTSYLTVITLLYNVKVGGSYFKPEWRFYIMSLIRDHEKCPFIPTTIVYVKQKSIGIEENDYPDIDVLFLPEMIIWDPISQFLEIFNDLQSQMLCSEDKCGKEAKFFKWQDESTEWYHPRCIYGMHGIVLLVCKIYRCSNGHTMTSCDPHFLDYFPDRHVIPFFLLHKSGATRKLQSFIFHLSSQGKSFADVQNILLWTIQISHAQKFTNRM